jgi:TRAP-type C4-dicarboxylate transport system permease small subunit
MIKAVRHAIVLMDRVIYPLSWVLTGISLFVMFLVVMAVVVTRYLVNLPFFWGEEFSRYAMFYMIMLGSAVAIRENGHLRLTLFADLLPRGPRRVLEFVTDLLMLGVIAAIFWYGLDLAVGDGNMRTPVLRWRYFWIYIAFPIGAAASALLMVGKQFAGTEDGA